MSYSAEVAIAAAPSQVWRVLADIEAWPSWSPSITAVVAEAPHEVTDSEVTDSEVTDGKVTGQQVYGGGDGQRSAYRVEQPPLPLGLWTITSWHPERGFTWQTRGASSLLEATFTVTGQGSATRVTHDLRWSGPMAWMARATYGPVSLKYADEHLIALARRCEAGG